MEIYRAILGIMAALFGLMPVWIMLAIHLKNKDNGKEVEDGR